MITPWLIEIIKKFIGNPEDKKAVLLSMVVSILVGIGVLWYSGRLLVTDALAIFATSAQVLGIASTVYQLFKAAVQKPVERIVATLTK